MQTKEATMVITHNTHDSAWGVNRRLHQQATALRQTANSDVIEFTWPHAQYILFMPLWRMLGINQGIGHIRVALASAISQQLFMYVKAKVTSS
jgi:hypothetical protein